MTPEQFTYWLQGFLELRAAQENPPAMTEEQVKMIRDHLATVFHKVTPDYTPTCPLMPYPSPLAPPYEPFGPSWTWCDTRIC